MNRWKRACAYLRKDPQTFFFLLRQQVRKRANLWYASRTGKSFFLQKLWLPITYRCNLRCQMCGQWGERGRSRKYASAQLTEELSLEKFKALIEEVAPLKPRVCLIGGEPFLFHEWEELARFIKQKKLFCEVTTNGLLLEEAADRIFLLFDAVHVSLDGPPEVNDAIRGAAGSFAKAFSGLRVLAEKKKKLRSAKPFLSVCCTLSQENMGTLSRLAQAIEAEQVSIDLLLFQHLEFCTPQIIAETNARWKEEFSVETDWWQANLHTFQETNFRHTYAQLQDIRSKRYSFIQQVMVEPDFSFSEMQYFYASPNRPLPRFREFCQAPFQEAFVYPDGTIWTCPGLPCGNIRGESFLKVFNGKKYRKLRKTLRDRGGFSICSRCANHWHNWST